MTIADEMLEHAESPDFRKKIHDALGRMGTPEEIAEVALFLATSAPELLVGQNLIVDGGYTIH